MVETGGGEGGIPGIIVIFPFIVFGLGLVFLFVAFTDKRGPKYPARKFVSRANHPLRHVQVSLNATRKTAREKAQEAARQKAAEAAGDDEPPKPEPPKKKKPRPSWLRRVS